LSLKKMRTVFSAMPTSRSAVETVPTPSSSRLSMAAYFIRFWFLTPEKRANASSGACSGVCTAEYARYMKNGTSRFSSACLLMNCTAFPVNRCVE